MTLLATVEDSLDVLVAQLPRETRMLLALGPVPESHIPYGCGVCSAMDATIAPDSPLVEIANIILDWHDVDDSTGPECYRRCCAIYQAAGWKGEQ